jgi:hypothetical protein
LPHELNAKLTCVVIYTYKATLYVSIYFIVKIEIITLGLKSVSETTSSSQANTHWSGLLLNFWYQP